MSDIAIVAVDPSGERFPHLVDDETRVGALIKALVARLRLPEELSYWLVPAGTDQPLHPDRALAASGVGPGARLDVVPARNGVFTHFVRRLYEEAKGLAKEEAWDRVRDAMRQIARLDPSYPDPAGLKLVADSVATDWPARPPARQEPATPPRPDGGVAPAAAGPPNPAPGAETGGLGCLIVALAVAGLVAYANRQDIVKWVEKQRRPNAVRAPNAGPTVNPPAPDPARAASNDHKSYGVFVVGDAEEVMCGEQAVLESTRRGVRFTMVLGPFATAAETRRAYENDLIPNSERNVGGVEDVSGIRLLGYRVARFRFDGREHRFDDALTFLR